jgi:hypothetical protein
MGLFFSLSVLISVTPFSSKTSIALILSAVEVLLEKGVTEIRTDNEKNNPMYKINVAL